MAGRNTQVSRIYSILNILEGAPHGLTVGDIWERAKDRGHEAHKRTIYRDLQALEGAGFPLSVADERWKLEASARVSQYFILSARELLALYLARNALAPLKDTPFYKDLESAFQRIEEKLGSQHRAHLDELSQEVRFEPGPRWGLGLNPEILETVRAACAEGHILIAEYDSVNSGKLRKRRLGPHYLYFAKGSVYLLAEDLEDKQVKLFSIPRIEKAEMTDESYTGVVTDPETYFAGAFGLVRGGEPVQVKIEFAKSVARYVCERGWHPSQVCHARPDGSVEMELFVAVTPELVQWVLGFGAGARVFEPLNLRTDVIAAAKSLIELYQQ